jgi:hypothetical protein
MQPITCRSSVEPISIVWSETSLTSPLFIPFRNKVAQLYPRALGSLYVPSYDSQGYDGSILTRLHMGFPRLEFEVEVTLRLTVSQLVSQSVCLGVEATLELVTRYYFLSKIAVWKLRSCFFGDALSDERTGLQYAVQSLNGPGRAEPVTILYCLILDSPNLVPVFIPPPPRN